jgi:GNAT superfamily N-acetyltransferase
MNEYSDGSRFPGGLTFFTPKGEEIERLLRFCARGIAGAELYTLLQMDGDGFPEGRVFCAEENGETVAAVYRGPDYTVTKAPGVYPVEELRLLRFKSARPCRPVFLMKTGLRELRAFTSLLADGKPGYEDGARYVYKARLLRDGFYRGYCVYENGALVSAAATVAENEDSALLGDVFTRPDYRGKGYASACVTFACADALSRGKTPWALCENETVPFYKKLGFEETDAV